MKTREQLKDEAYEWACDYIMSQEEIELTCVFEGMKDGDWEKHLDFITDCFEHGLKPVHFIDTLIANQEEYNQSFDWLTDE